MVILVDANILIDVLAKREPFHISSSRIWKYCETNLVTGHVSALTFANLVYVLSRELTARQTEETLHTLSLIFSVEDLKLSDLEHAAALHWSDFEDAIQYVTAGRVKADYIVSRNPKDYENQTIPVKSPEEVCALIKSFI